MSNNIKAISTVVLAIFLFIISSKESVYAEDCSYNSTITGDHIDIQVESNNYTNLGVLEIVSRQGPIWTQLYQPSDVTWITSWNNLIANVYFGLMGGDNGETAYWGYNATSIEDAKPIPYGIYGADSNINLTINDYFVQMNHPQNMGSDYTICTRLGEVDNQTPTPTPTASPSPTPTPTATPTPTPTPTPLPVNKVVFIPGFGGSWNTNAFLNCSFDPNPDNWSLAPYAADVYNPILTALNSTGWNTKPFYYDWRAQVPNNSNVLGNVINNFATTPEKVNIVGHSMGGLVGANYLSNDQGTKTNSLLTIGSPFKGVPIAYPAWSAGDIWQDNFIGKIAVNLYLKRCGKLNPTKEIVRSQFPAIQNLLPIFDYLKNGNILKPWSTMFAKNNWLPLVFDNNFWGVKFETLTGSGFDTLSQIPVKSASPKDIKDGNYLDGKPNGKITTLNGDGTVLLTSAKIDDIHNVTITQNHQGLVNSIDGMTEILKFLGSSTSAPLLTSSEINSSLIIIADSNNFWVTDSNGNTKKDKGGIIAFNNPKSGNYKFTLLPNNFDSIVIVAQLLPNGEFLYKEYNFKNFLPKFKTFEIVN